MTDDAPFPPLPPDESAPESAFDSAPSRGNSGRGNDRGSRRRLGSAGRVPPHNLEAEESVLGALLLSREAIGTVSELGLVPDDFYRPAHRHIYDAVRSLYASAGPVDVVTVADELRELGSSTKSADQKAFTNCRT